ncbi:MAG: hypothetical protein R3F21_13070 [Myxococcota bacterium]
MLVELQALVAPAPYGTPRRTTLGLEDARVALLLACSTGAARSICSQDVYAKAAGGVRVAAAADLAIALAVAAESASSWTVPPDTAAMGETGLGASELRRVSRRRPGRGGGAAELRRVLVRRSASVNGAHAKRARGAARNPNAN